MSELLVGKEFLMNEIRKNKHYLESIKGEIRNFENDINNNSYSGYYKSQCQKKLDQLYPQRETLIKKIQLYQNALEESNN